ncbi:MAG: VWA domain-containing protein [Methanothrix sp.]
MRTDIIIILIVLSIFYIIAADDSIAKSSAVSTSDKPPAKIASYEDNEVKILRVDSSAFPRIKVTILINRFCAIAGSLKKEDFTVKENDTEVIIDDFYQTGNASGQKLDLAIVFDETTSMDEEINALKIKVKDLTQKINSSKVDARYSLVAFNETNAVTMINWTNDVTIFKNTISKISLSGGNPELPENSLEGIERVLSSGFRPEAQKVIVVVTDEPSQQKGYGKNNSNYAMEDVRRDLLNAGTILIAVSPDFSNPTVDPGVPRSILSNYADMRVLANETGSLWIDSKIADFSTILEQIEAILTGIYVIEYTSPNQAPFERRIVLVSVGVPECVADSVSDSYTSPESITCPNESIEIYSRRSNQVSSLGTSFSTITNLRVSPDGTQILFPVETLSSSSKAIDYFGEIYAIDTKTNRPGFIEYGRCADWSPDGNRIVYLGNKEDLISTSEPDTGNTTFFDTQVYILDKQDNKVAIMDSSKPLNGIVWSPDGNEMAFSLKELGFTYIYLIDINGSEVKKLTNESLSPASSPKWSPDGLKIAFYSNSTGNGDIYVMDVDGSNVKQLTGSGIKEIPEDWSHDGKKILYSAGNSLLEMNVDGRQKQEIINSDRFISAAAFSIDDKSVYYSNSTKIYKFCRSKNTGIASHIDHTENTIEESMKEMIYNFAS